MSLAIGPSLQAFSGGLPILDLRITYTVAEVNELFLALGPEGLALYSVQLIVDMFFPLMYSLTMTFAMIYLAPDFIKEKKGPRIIIFLPFLGAGLDYLENMLIATQIAAFPNLSQQVILFAGAVTWAKWILMFIIFILLMLFLVKAISPTTDDDDDN
jgi:hypothetical protein